MNPEELRPFALFMEQHGLDYLEVRKGQFHLILKKPGATVPEKNSAHPVPSAAEPAESEKAAESVEVPSDHVKVVSPLVGTFYRAPSPGSPPFVDVGTAVKPDDTLCIVEAMKVMNEIKAECAGVVRSILVDNGAPVEYGQTLFLIERA